MKQYCNDYYYLGLLHLGSFSFPWLTLGGACRRRILLGSALSIIRLQNLVEKCPVFFVHVEELFLSDNNKGNRKEYMKMSQLRFSS